MKIKDPKKNYIMINGDESDREEISIIILFPI